MAAKAAGISFDETVPENPRERVCGMIHYDSIIYPVLFSLELCSLSLLLYFMCCHGNPAFLSSILWLKTT